MKRLLVLAFGILLTVGCWGCAGSLLAGKPKGAPAPPDATDVIPVWVDAKFSPREMGEVDSAIDAWNRALNGYADLFVVSRKITRPCDDAEVMTRMLVTQQGLTINVDDLDPDTIDTHELGHWDPDTNSIHILAEKMGFRDLRRVVMHEIGHTFIGECYPHLPIRGALMFPIYDFQASCVDWATAMAVAHVQKWDVRFMNYCDPWGTR